MDRFKVVDYWSIWLQNLRTTMKHLRIHNNHMKPSPVFLLNNRSSDDFWHLSGHQFSSSSTWFLMKYFLLTALSGGKASHHWRILLKAYLQLLFCSLCYYKLCQTLLFMKCLRLPNVGHWSPWILITSAWFLGKVLLQILHYDWVLLHWKSIFGERCLKNGIYK